MADQTKRAREEHDSITAKVRIAENLFEYRNVVDFLLFYSDWKLRFSNQHTSLFIPDQISAVYIKRLCHRDIYQRRNLFKSCIVVFYICWRSSGTFLLDPKYDALFLFLILDISHPLIFSELRIFPTFLKLFLMSWIYICFQDSKYTREFLNSMPHSSLFPIPCVKYTVPEHIGSEIFPCERSWLFLSPGGETSRTS